MANENIQELKFQVGEAWKGVYSSTTAYGLANVVQDPTGLSIYRSLKSGNVGHPVSDRTWWFCIIDLSSIKAESDRIAALNEAIAQDEALRVAAEELRQQHEAERVAAETQRNETEQARISAEQARVNAESARATAEQQRITDEQGRVSAESARVTAEQARVLAETLRANAEDARAANEQNRVAAEQQRIANEQARETQYAADHSRAEADHETAVQDNAQMTELVERADADHVQAASDHTRADSDHATAASDHTQAEQDHTTAAADHTQAGNDHTRAESDHTRAESDHAAVEVYVDSLGVFDLSKHNAVGGVLATYADLSAALTALNALDSKYKYGGMSFKFVQSSDNKYVQFRCISNEFTTDTIKWAICDNDVLVENPEFIEVKTDSEGKVLEGIQKGGTKVFGADVNIGGSATVNKDLKVIGKTELEGISYEVIQSSEWAIATVDAEGKVLYGVKFDGKFYGDIADIPSEVQAKLEVLTSDINTIQDKISLLESILSIENNPEYIQVETDLEGKILGGRRTDGTKFETLNLEVQKKLSTESLVVAGTDITDNIEAVNANTYIKDSENRLEVKTDADGRILAFRDSEGKVVENVGVVADTGIFNHLMLTENGMSEFGQALKDSGLELVNGTNWSDYLSNDGEQPLNIPMPRCAVINLLTDYDLTQLSKKGYGPNPPYWPAGVEGVTFDIPIEVEFWDMQGNYFKKKAYIGGQGASTMNHNKKNIALDLFDSDWGEDAFSIRFGNWVAQDSFHLKAYDYERFVGAGVWAYQLFNEMLKSRGPEEDYVWKKALLNYSENTSTTAYGSSIDETSIFDDTNARCVPDGFPVIVFQKGEFWGVFSMQLKKHRDNYHMSKSSPENIHLDGHLEGRYMWDGSINWGMFEVRNPKNLVYSTEQSGTYKYDADLPGQLEIAGNNDGTFNYDTWSAGSYTKDKIVEYNGHYYLNTVEGNTKEPVYDKKNNSDSSPDFKNKTKCNWLNVTNTVKVKSHIITLSGVMAKIEAKKDAYIEEPTAENLTALKAEFETYFNVDNLIDYIIINDVINNADAFDNNWQWTTYDGNRWWCNLYDTNISFGYIADGGVFRAPLTAHIAESRKYMMEYIFQYYSTELNARYAELRNLKILDASHIYEDIIKSWVDRISLYYISLEDSKWESAKTIDNIFRIKKWIEANISNLDAVYDYNQN